MKFDIDTYELDIPKNLPPSHRGKICIIVYKLVIGIQKDAHRRKTKVFSIPFRLFNRTESDGSRPVYEVLNPAIYTRDEAQVFSPIEPTLVSPLFPLSPLDQSPRVTPNESRKSSLAQIDAEYETNTIENVSLFIQMSNKGRFF